METKGFFQFAISINVLVSSFHFIRIPMLWVFGHHKCLNSFGVGTIFRRQNHTSIDAERLHTEATLFSSQFPGYSPQHKKKVFVKFMNIGWDWSEKSAKFIHHG